MSEYRLRPEEKSRFGHSTEPLFLPMPVPALPPIRLADPLILSAEPSATSAASEPVREALTAPVTLSALGSSPRWLSGMVAPWGFSSRNVWTTDDGIRHRCQFAAGAFDGSLKQLAAGEVSLPLLLEHDRNGPVLLRLEDWGVGLSSQAEGLMLYVQTGQSHSAGRALAEYIQRNPDWRFMSPSYNVREYQWLGSGDVKTMLITEAELNEVSLVRRAGFGNEHTELFFTDDPLRRSGRTEPLSPPRNSPPLPRRPLPDCIPPGSRWSTEHQCYLAPEPPRGEEWSPKLKRYVRKGASALAPTFRI